jgi:hypothetical protein
MSRNSNPSNPHPETQLTKPGESLPADLMDLIHAVGQLPAADRAPLEGPLSRVVDYTRRRRRILDLIQEALGQLRLDMKYLMFDLESTRRERDDYKKSLDGNQ